MTDKPAIQPFDPFVTTIPVESPSCFGAVVAVPHAVATRETIVTMARVSWRRDMGDSGVGKQ
jgi:hypothetical protein